MQDFIQGQRWISEAELPMGLGTVVKADLRTVDIVFLATGETRTYAKQSAPLTRVRFSPGDDILSHDGVRVRIKDVVEHEHLLTYHGIDERGTVTAIPEGDLDHHIQLSRPTDRLFSGQIDKDPWFTLRSDALGHLNQLARSTTCGLGGCRTSLIPHQLYIANEVAKRYAPRVLLADEVGLGKTIEAGLILHHQLLSERVQRVLIVVPQNLMLQWLVEMLRRFNLLFHIYDEHRCQQAPNDSASNENNPFFEDQLILCSLEFLTENPDHFAHCLQADWDLMVVDEAHHLRWDNDGSASIEYDLISQLATITPGVLLLTATPEQLGRESHFARLRLLDPDRFSSYTRFVDEEKAFAPLADVIEALLQGKPLTEPQHRLINTTLAEQDNAELLTALRSTDVAIAEQARNDLVDHLLDRHGTGRVLFRNTRAAISGFPKRQLHGYGLRAADGDESDFDRRSQWLMDFLRDLKPEKVLVITSLAETAMALVEALRVDAGIHTSAFHEGLSLIERDRAAAFFSDPDYGSQTLICSEIGSEGRNFQFAHHLVMFDLPINPDLLEQRIGRLDRIGQTQTIRIHVPYIIGSDQSVLYRWYHEALDAFEKTCPAAHKVYSQVTGELDTSLRNPHNSNAVDALIARSSKLREEINNTLHRGRDRLLEYNSCRPAIAAALCQQTVADAQLRELAAFMESVYESVGVESEPHSLDCIVIRPGDHMVCPLPGLYDDGMTITYSREVALGNEDIHFLTWDHPLVRNALDLIVSGEFGNTSVISMANTPIKAGTLLVEAIYTVTSTENAAHRRRQLPPAIIRLVLDEQQNQHSLETRVIAINSEPVDAQTAREIIKLKEASIRNMTKHCDALAKRLAPERIQQSAQGIDHMLKEEVARLTALANVNPTVRKDEIDFFNAESRALHQSIKTATPMLDALRIIITT